VETKIPLAFVAGLLSFVTPCVLPLVPGYLSAVSGMQIGVGGRKVVAASIPFIAGFTLVFVALGAVAGAAGGLVHDQRLLSMVAGVIVVVFGFAFMGLLPFPWLDRMVAPELVEGARRRGSRALLGGAFGVCAAPCIGPVLATILALAGDASTAAQGSLLLLVYSLGLAVPFVLVGIGFDRAMGASRWLRDRYDVVRFISGALLVAVGEPGPGEPDRLRSGVCAPHDRAPLDLVEPCVHPLDRLGPGGELVPARGGESDRHVHLPEPDEIGDLLQPLALEPEGHFSREAGGRRHVGKS